MEVKDLEKALIIFKYPLNHINWLKVSGGDLDSVLVSFYSMQDDVGEPYYVLSVLNVFNADNVSEKDITSCDVLFGPVLCEQPLLRGANKWADLFHLEKSENYCYHPKFYGATSKRTSDIDRKSGQYFWKAETSAYQISTFDEIGHLESPVIYNDFTLEVRTYLELLRLKNPDHDAGQLDGLLKEALIDSKTFKNDPIEEIDQWAQQFVLENVLVPPSNLINQKIRGKLKSL